MNEKAPVKIVVGQSNVPHGLQCSSAGSVWVNVWARDAMRAQRCEKSVPSRCNRLGKYK